MTPTLHQFFHRHIQHGFKRAGLAEPAIMEYVSDLLTRFARTEALFPLHDEEERPLTTLVQFLVAQRTAQEEDHVHEIMIVRHLAEYTLFMSGFFRGRLRARGQLSYYADHGRTAYARSADLEKNAGRARTYWRLQQNFAGIAETLDEIRCGQLPLPPDTLNQPLAALWRM